MSFRTWLYNQLTLPDDVVLRGLVGDRVFAKKSMSSSVEEHPYIVFKLGNATNLGFAETQEVIGQFFQIYVYDYGDTESGDYIRIDSIITHLRSILVLQSSGDDGIISVAHLETSQDLEDSTLRAMLKYVRFQATLSKVPSLI